jgi:uncharacterized membrane protein
VVEGLPFIGYLALTIAALFTGAAVYVNFAEQPARLGLKDRPLLAEWKTAYKRGAIMQASLAIAGFILGALAWWQAGKPAFIIGAFLMLAPWPWTLLIIKPINDTLMATDPAKADAETRALIVKWDRLHLVRTALGALGTIAFLYALAAD